MNNQFETGGWLPNAVACTRCHRWKGDNVPDNQRCVCPPELVNSVDYRPKAGDEFVVGGLPPDHPLSGVNTIGEAQVVHESGARRSERKPHYHSITHQLLSRVARRHSLGDSQYGEYNWRKGLPMGDTFNHIVDHLYKWKGAIELGWRPTDDHGTPNPDLPPELAAMELADDHLAAVVLGVEFLMWGEEGYLEEVKRNHETGGPTYKRNTLSQADHAALKAAVSREMANPRPLSQSIMPDRHTDTFTGVAMTSRADGGGFWGYREVWSVFKNGVIVSVWPTEQEALDHAR